MHSRQIPSLIFAMFLGICVMVHVYGLLHPFSSESTESHLIHIGSYALCLVSFTRAVPYRSLLFVAGSVYPVCYHAACAWQTYQASQSLNPVCLLVTFALPLGAFWLFRLHRHAEVSNA